MLKTKLTLALCGAILVSPTRSVVHLTTLPVANNVKVNNDIPKSSAEPKAPLNKMAAPFVKRYIRNSSGDLNSIKHRSTVPFGIIDSVFASYGLPVELKYLAVIESELKPAALSRVGALGPWQLMPGTAHILGLKVTSRNDERKSYSKSTRAAAKYLKDLYAQFGDWLLVIAAYNSGPAPVNHAMHMSGSRNFWALQNYLPKETSLHVKRFIATHYYFEGQGSLTTLTKKEAEEYKKRIAQLASTSLPSDKKEETVTQEKPVIINESAEEKFRRLMKTSAESLNKSNQLLESK
jgi:Transglycosylase SLT domain